MVFLDAILKPSEQSLALGQWIHFPSVILAQAADSPTDLSTEYVDVILEALTKLGLKALAAIAIFIIGRWLAKLFSNGLKHFLNQREVDAIVINFVASLFYYGMLTAAVIVALSQLGVQTASFVAILGAAGLAIGLALQGSLSNFAAGVLLIIFRPFRTGDFVEAGGATGIVDSVEIFTTTLKTLDNRRVIVPNSNILSGNITDYSAYPTRRVDLVFGISYTDDIDRARQIIADVLRQDERILADPAPTVQVFELADSSVNFAVRPWVENANYWTVLCDTTETVKKQFDAAGISIPFPQQDVYMHHVN